MKYMGWSYRDLWFTPGTHVRGVFRMMQREMDQRDNDKD